jgi:hypothetical protein
LARQLGAGHYIDSTAADPAAELQRLGGAKIIVATATNARAIAATIGGLSLDDRVVVLGADYTPVALNTTALIGKRTGPLRVAFRFIHRFGRHDEILGDERCARHDRNVSARENAGGIRPDDEQQGSVPMRPHHWKLRTALPSAPASEERAYGPDRHASQWCRTADKLRNYGILRAASTSPFERRLR